MTLSPDTPVGVVGAGTMGRGIAQVAATAGHPVVLTDTSSDVLARAMASLEKIHARLVEKGRLDESDARAILDRITTSDSIDAVAKAGIVIEAIIENPDVKRSVFETLDGVCADDAILATNTSSLSITSIASAVKDPSRVVGAHFFNPAPLLPLVEVVPGLATSDEVTDATRERMAAWGKVPVVAKDTPGFIVNRVARPFYGESIRILEEGVADVATIDWALTEVGGFRMGPFTLMDLIGNDVNLTVTETVFEAFFYDPRFKPSFTQKRLVEAGRLGRKTGQGYYDHRDGAENPDPVKDPELGEAIVNRVVAMLINEAADAVFCGIASVDDVDLAMTKGVNYPKGLLRWADELGIETVLDRLTALHEEYGEDRYRPNPLLRRMVRGGLTFHPADADG